MDYKIRFKREALKQLDALYQYISEESPGSAVKVTARVHAFFVRVGMFPIIGRSTDEDGVHCFVVGKTGLLIFYTFDKGTITIIRILHERQKRD